MLKLEKNFNFRFIGTLDIYKITIYQRNKRKIFKLASYRKKKQIKSRRKKIKLKN